MSTCLLFKAFNVKIKPESSGRKHLFAFDYLMWFVKPKHADFFFIYITRSKSVSPVCIEAEMQVSNKGLDL